MKIGLLPSGNRSSDGPARQVPSGTPAFPSALNH